MSEKKYVRRILPCPAYDLEALESWLSDMAAEGLLLADKRHFYDTAVFEKVTACSAKYRLEAVVKESGLYSVAGDAPSDELLELAQAYGWEYVTRLGQFFVYRSFESCPRELNTDPQVHALAVKALNRRRWGVVFETVFRFFVWIILLPMVRLRAGLLMLIIENIFAYYLLATLLLAWYVADAVREVIHLGRLQRKLRSQEPLDHSKSWKQHAVRRRWAWACQLVLMVTVIVSIILVIPGFIKPGTTTSLADYHAQPPFATAGDLYPQGTYTSRDTSSVLTSQVRVWSSPISACNYQWEEYARITFEDGAVASCTLYIDYHYMADPQLAQALAEEYHTMDRHADKDYVLLPIPEPDADYAIAYRSGVLHDPTVVIRKGNTVLHASFYQYSDGFQIPLEQWVQTMAESLVEATAE